jgi:hypothetical protein
MGLIGLIPTVGMTEFWQGKSWANNYENFGSVNGDRGKFW